MPLDRIALSHSETTQNWRTAAAASSNLAQAELLLGEMAKALATSARSIDYAKRHGKGPQELISLAGHAATLHQAGRRDDAKKLFVEAELLQQKLQPQYPLLYSSGGYYYADFLLDEHSWKAVQGRAEQTLQWVKGRGSLLSVALSILTSGRAHLGFALSSVASPSILREVVEDEVYSAIDRLNEATQELRHSGQNDDLLRGLLARIALHRGSGSWQLALNDLHEVEEIAEVAPMRLFLCDMALEHARLAFARMEAVAPLNGILKHDSPPRPVVPSAEEVAKLKGEAAKQIKIADDYIQTCGYHRRDEELAELQAVLRGERKFAELPPRV